MRDDQLQRRAPGSTPTRASGPTPSPTRWCASRLARASSSAYVSASAPHDQRPRRPACARACASNSSWMHGSAGTAAPSGSTPPARARAPPRRAAPAAKAARPRPRRPAPAPAPGGRASARSCRARRGPCCRSVRRAGPAAVAVSARERSNLAVASSASTPLTRSPGKRGCPPPPAFCSVNITWKSGEWLRAALRLQLGHQLLEGHLLVLVRAQRRPPAPAAAPRGSSGRRRGRCAAPAC